MYNYKYGTFFIPVGELGFDLYEMFAVSLLFMGELPYDKTFLTMKKLRHLKVQDPHVYEIYEEVMCHFCICSNVSGTNGQGISQKLWANYLFQDVDHPEVTVTKLALLN